MNQSLVGTPRRGVPARVVAGGTGVPTRAAVAMVAPLDTARMAQRAIPTLPSGSSSQLASKYWRFSFPRIDCDSRIFVFIKYGHGEAMFSVESRSH